MEIKRCYPVLVGASVVENQLCNGESVTVPNGHKYYLKTDVAESLGASTGTAITGLTSGSDMVIDLTQLLGTAIADRAYSLGSDGLSWLRTYGFLSDGYIPYNAGSIKSVEVTEKKVVGFNQWDEEWQNGYYGISGDFFPNASYVACKNKIPVLPNTQYCISSQSKYIGRICFYDADENFISTITGIQSVTTYVFATSSNAHYMTFDMVSSYGATYNHDICINLSSDRNGEYEPYKSTSYSLGNDTLRGIFKLDANNNLYADGDRKEADGTVTRGWKQVTYNGSESWEVETADINGYRRFYIGDNTIKRMTDYRGNILNSRGYEIANGYRLAYDPAGDVLITAYNASESTAIGRNWLYICTKLTTMNINTVSEFKTWLASNPVDMLLPLATPTTEQSTPFASPQIVYPDGTEAFVTENGVPVGHETKYQL